MTRCGSCGQESPEGFSFCGSCGALLAETAVVREERKVVTVVYADVVGSTARAEGLDPEDVRAVLGPFHARVRSELERFGGTVEKFIGDAVVALFGAPLAHEDDSERAVRAALAIQDAIVELNESTPGLELEVRVGVATGEALVAIDARLEAGEALASGDVMNTGSRLQAAAPPGGVLVAEPTYRATEHVIDYEPVAPVVGKGKSAPILAWRALQPRARLGIDVRQHGAVALMGRRRELDLLLGALDRSRSENETQLVTLVGVPGIGKSRLVFEVLRAVEDDPELITWRQGRCLPYGDGVTFWAVGEMVKAHAGILESDSPASAEAKLRRSLPGSEDAALLERHLRPLVGLPVESAAGDITEAFAAWRRFFEAVAEEGPLVLVFEDLHWADDQVLDFVDHLADWARGVPLLVLCTARPELLERRPGWGGGKLNATTVALSPLGDRETEELVAALAQDQIDEPAVATVLAHAGGNPLYAEQYVRMLLDRGDTGAALPETVHGIIAARLDGLPPAEKELLHRGAVIGKVFWGGAVGALENERADVEASLHQLERKEFVRRERRSSVGGETEYAFRHALVRDVAYGQIPRSGRAALHRRAAEWIESLSERVEDLAELRVHHWLSALEYARQAHADTDALELRARQALIEASDRAEALVAVRAAERWLSQALALWPEDGSTERLLVRARREFLEFQFAAYDEAEAISIRDALLARGRQDDAVLMEGILSFAAFNEGRRADSLASRSRLAALVDSLPPSSNTVFALGRLARGHVVDVEPEPALERGLQMLALAEELSDEPTIVDALINVGTARAMLGDEEGFADLAEAVRRAKSIGSLLVVRAFQNAGSTRIDHGRLEEGFQLQAAGLRAAERIGTQYLVVWFTAERALEGWWRGRWDEAVADADAVVHFVETTRPHYMESLAREVRANVFLARDDVDGALAESALAAEQARAHGGQVTGPLVSRLRICLAAGLRTEAEAIAEELVADDLRSVWIAAPAAPFAALGGAADVLAAPAPPAPSLWHDAALLYAQGDVGGAARVFGAIGSLPDEAEARLRSGRALLDEGRVAEGRAEIERALAFWRSVGASRYVREAEAVLAAAAS